MISAQSLNPEGARQAEPAQPLLKVRGLTRLYGVQKGCQDVSLDLYPGEVLGIVGES
ncbi:phosphonate C-P lyase system protein PhnK, partial [Pseudomonas syringae pv. actinidiae ICMP 18804]